MGRMSPGAVNRLNAILKPACVECALSRPCPRKLHPLIIVVRKIQAKTHRGLNLYRNVSLIGNRSTSGRSRATESRNPRTENKIITADDKPAFLPNPAAMKASIRMTNPESFAAAPADLARSNDKKRRCRLEIKNFQTASSFFIQDVLIIPIFYFRLP